MTPKEYWDDYAASCVAGGKVGGTSERRAIVQTDLLNQGWTGQILEVGCGAGINLKIYPNTKGCDISPNMVALSEVEEPNVDIISDNLLPYITDQFDIVFTVTCLQHVTVAPDILCTEMLRVGKKIFIYEDIGDGSQYDVYYIRRSIVDYEQLLGASITSRQVDGDLYCLEF